MYLGRIYALNDVCHSACVDPGTADELHMVEVEGQDMEGQKIKAVLVSLRPSTLPSVCLGGFTITPPATFRLKAGSGPIHISGQHLVMMEADQSFDEDDEEEEEEEEEEVVTASKKRPASSPAAKSHKKMKIEMEDEDEDDEDDEDESEEEESPVKAKVTPSKQQNGKSSKPSTPAKKQDKTPKGKGERTPKTPTTPKTTPTIPELKSKMMESVKKGVKLPNVQAKFENFVKNGLNVADTKIISDLWKWRQTVKDTK
ncbi:nucleophosmin 1a [Notothenia coriiceps]|uniref:Nucleophosmin 1a n=1 Tax=Notothenia coriiceps TaxID=8208 RepID=A0A6I9MN52_9TELE|nr:PREDICTED: nucleophosmin-like [Notothenia coriiceps]